MHIDEYRKLAETEDPMWYFHALNRRMLLPLRSWGRNKARVLDAGCGTGGLIRTLSRFNPDWKITGLDFSPIACALARETTQAEIVEGSITDLPFPPPASTSLTCADVLSQVEDGSEALREFARVLRPGGVLVVNVAAYQWMWSYHDDTCETRHRYRRSELMGLVKACGLRPLQASYANTLLFPFIIARRKILPPRSATSDVKVYPPVVDSICATVAGLEYVWLRQGGFLPTGCSVFLTASRS